MATNDWTVYSSDGSFCDNETDVDFIGGDKIGVRCNQGYGYGAQYTNTTFPVGLMAEMLRHAGYNVTPQAPEFCVACKRFLAAVNDSRFPQYAQMHADNLAEHRREVHGEVSP